MGLAKFLAVVVLLGLGAFAVVNATGDPAESSASTAKCSERAAVDRSPLWSSALTLEDLGQSAQAEQAAVEAIQRTGGLPHDASMCADIKELLTPQDTSSTQRLNDWFKDNWWILAILVAIVVAGMGHLIRQRWWRENRWRPRVSLQVAAADADATGFDNVGAQMGGIVRSQLLQLGTQGIGPRLNYVTAGDADVDLPPIDEVPAKAQWLIQLVQWLGKRNRLSLTMIVTQAQQGRAQVVAHVREPSGQPTRGRTGEARQVLVERPAPLPAEQRHYLSLATPVAAWTLFQLKDITNQTAELRQQVGTASWEAWARLQEGVTALDTGDVERATADFAAAHHLDDSQTFLELRLNSAYADARSEDPIRWQQALADLRELVQDTAP